MVIFLVVVAIFILLFIILLQHRITVGFTFKMDKLVCSAYVNFYLFGIIPTKRIQIFPRPIKKKKKDRVKKVRKKRDIKQLRISLWVLAKLFYKSLIIKEFKLCIKEGMGDAAYTAIIYGLLWNLTALIPIRLFKKHKVKEKIIRIEPDFKEKNWKVDFNCIFSLKIVNIISIVRELIKIILKNRKGGDAGVRSSNRRSNDYSHAKY